MGARATFRDMVRKRQALSPLRRAMNLCITAITIRRQGRSLLTALMAVLVVTLFATLVVGLGVDNDSLMAFTMTGETARRLARYRSPIPLLAFTTESATRSQLALTWGAETFLVPSVAHTDDMVRQVEAALLEITRCQVGDLVVMVAGSPPGTPGRTNALRVHRIGDAVES